MIANRNEAKKKLVKHISRDCKCKFNSATYNSNQNWNNEICLCNCKNDRTCKKITVGILIPVFARMTSI